MKFSACFTTELNNKLTKSRYSLYCIIDLQVLKCCYRYLYIILILVTCSIKRDGFFSYCILHNIYLFAILESYIHLLALDSHYLWVSTELEQVNKSKDSLCRTVRLVWPRPPQFL